MLFSRLTKRTLLVLACLFLASGSRAVAQSIRDIRVGYEDGRTRGVIELDQDLNYTIFYLASPPRLVVDVAGLDEVSAVPITAAKAGLVRDVRLGEFNANLTRVVFDLDQSAQLDQTFFLDPRGDAAYRLVIDMRPGQGSANGTILAERQLARDPKPDQAELAPDPPATAPTKPQLICAGCETQILPPPRPAHLTPQKYIIVIDPGHGGRDPGAIGANNVKEADIVLTMAQEIYAELTETGDYEVYLTRSTDRLVPLGERAELARGRAADFFLSIHANANPDPSFRGFMVFTLSDSVSDAYAAEVAAQENKSELGAIASIEDKDVGNILGDILLRDTMNQSIDFANVLVERLRGRVRLPSTAHRRAGFVVLKSVRMPSALLEIGHLTNARELRALQSPRHRRKIAVAVHQALDEYFANN